MRKQYTPLPPNPTLNLHTQTQFAGRGYKNQVSTAVTIGALGLNVFTVNYNIWLSP